MTPLEAMARALKRENHDYFGLPWHEEMPIDPLFFEQARAALAALRDCGVTEGMRKAWAHTSADCGPEVEFRAMLDAVLEDG